MMNNSGRPLSTRKKIQILIALTILAWATQTLFHQWGYGQEIPVDPLNAPTAAAEPAAYQTFVPRTLVAGAGTIELRNDATIYGGDIKLKQLCRWSDADAAAFASVADLTVAHFDKNSATKSIALDDLRNTLRDAGVNIAVIRFAGSTACTVNRGDFVGGDRAALQQWIDQSKPSADATASQASDQSLTTVPSPASKPSVAVSIAPAASATDSTAARSLHDLLMTDLSQRLNVPIELLQVNFDPKDTNLLNLAEPNFRFEIQARHVRDLGQVSWDVSIFAGSVDTGRQKVAVNAEARAWQQQMVVGRPIAFQGIIRDEDITERRVLIEHLSETPVLTRDQVVGQQAGRDIQTGTILTARLVESVPLAKPGQYVTVTLSQGTVQLKTVAKAMESGSFGQSIKVKNEATKEIFEVTLTGPQAAMMGAAPTTDAGLASANQK